MSSIINYKNLSLITPTPNATTAPGGKALNDNFTYIADTLESHGTSLSAKANNDGTSLLLGTASNTFKIGTTSPWHFKKSALGLSLYNPSEDEFGNFYAQQFIASSGISVAAGAFSVDNIGDVTAASFSGDGGGLTGITIDAAANGLLLTSNNLSDVPNKGLGRTNLGLGSIATQSAASVAITGGSIAGVTTLTTSGDVLASATTSATAPRFSFTSDTDTGVGHGAADSVNLICGGTARLTATTTGATVNGICTATTFSGSGSSLTSIPAGNLTGTVAVARLPAIVAFTNADNNFSTAQTFQSNVNLQNSILQSTTGFNMQLVGADGISGDGNAGDGGSGSNITISAGAGGAGSSLIPSAGGSGGSITLRAGNVGTDVGSGTGNLGRIYLVAGNNDTMMTVDDTGAQVYGPFAADGATFTGGLTVSSGDFILSSGNATFNSNVDFNGVVYLNNGVIVNSAATFQNYIGFFGATATGQQGVEAGTTQQQLDSLIAALVAYGLVADNR